MKPVPYEDVIETLWQYSDLFWQKVEIAEPEACWLWKLRPTDQGYGQIKFNGFSFRAHRIAWFLTNGDIPEPLVPDHLCAVRNCVNPNHLDIVTMKVNSGRGLGPTGANSRKTHCVNGHELAGGNLHLKVLKRRVQRICRECNRHIQNSPEYKAKKIINNRNYQARLTAKRRAEKCLTS